MTDTCSTVPFEERVFNPAPSDYRFNAVARFAVLRWAKEKWCRLVSWPLLSNSFAHAALEVCGCTSSAVSVADMSKHTRAEGQHETSEDDPPRNCSGA